MSVVIDRYHALADIPQGVYWMNYTLSLAGPRTVHFRVDMQFLPRPFAAETRAGLVYALTTTAVEAGTNLHLGSVRFGETTQVILEDSAGTRVFSEYNLGRTYYIPAGKMNSGERYVLTVYRSELAPSPNGSPPFVNYSTALRIDFTAPAAPKITLQPVAVQAATGGTATLSAAVSGAPQPSFQWLKNGVPVAGAMQATLTLTNVQANDAGMYAVVATNAVGSVTSAPAELRIGSSERLVAVSTRSNAGANEDTLIGGFVINGPKSKDVLVRAVGPTLAGMGLAGAMANPRLQVYRRQTPIAENNDWGLGARDGADARDAAERLGAFPLASGSADAALVANLQPGVYTAHVTSAAGGAGIVLLEIYDAGATSTDDSKLVALATRGRVEPGDGVLIAGFVIRGDRMKRVMVRGVGPGMAGQVSSALSDPILTIFSGSTPILENNNWSDAENASDLAEVARITGASALAAGSKDAGVLLELPPGVYTAHVRGVGGATGVALVEIYEAP